MKNLFLTLFFLSVTMLSFCQKNIDTIFVVSITLQVDEDGGLNYVVKSSDSSVFWYYHKFFDSTYFSDGIVRYFDNETKSVITKHEYETSIFNELYGTEIDRYLQVTYPVVCTGVNISNSGKFKYEILTDKNISYFPNYPPEIGDVVFLTTDSGKIVKN